MRKITACILAIIISASQSAFANASDSQSAAEEVRKLESRINEAIVKGDVEFFDGFLADDFTHTSASGRLRTKAEWMKGRKPGQSAYVSYETSDLKVRLYGDSAVVTGLSDAKWREDGQTMRGQYRFIRVWTKRDGQWKAVAFQSTKIGSE